MGPRYQNPAPLAPSGGPKHYSSLPNTRPRVSSPLTAELTFDEGDLAVPTSPSRTVILLVGIADLLISLRLGLSVAPHLGPHLAHHLPPLPLASLRNFSTPLSDAPPALLLAAFVALKTLGGICLLSTGTPPTAYLLSTLAVYTTLAGFLVVPAPPGPLALAALLFGILAAVVALCLPLLRLVELLLDLDDNPPAQTLPKPQPMGARRRSASPRMFKRRYHHLLAPF